MGRDENLARLRTRPRGPDIPDLRAFYPPISETLEQSVSEFLILAAQLIDTNRYLETWRVVRTAAEHDAATGLDIINNPEGFIVHLRGRGDDNSLFSISALGFSSKIARSAPNIYTASLSYSGGMDEKRFNEVSFFAHNEDSTPPHTLTLKEWLRVVTEIITWRIPRYIAIGSGNYPIHDRVFDHRAWNGWIGWFPVRITPQSLPSYALTFDIGPGTLVATQDTNVITNDPAQLERAKEVEIALAQLGVLPTNDYLLGRAEQ